MREEPYDELYSSLGRIVHEWTQLESSVADLVFDLCSCLSDSFYKDKGVGRVSAMLHANVDLRTNTALAKSLCLTVAGEGDYFKRLETALNHINAVLRTERNRCVHDLWYVIQGRPIRIKPGSVIRPEPGSGKKRDDLVTKRDFSDFAEMAKVADDIHAARKGVRALSEEAREIYRQTYPPEE